MKSITLARKKTVWEEETLKDTNAQHMNSDCLWSCFYLLKTFYENEMSTHHALMQGRMFMSRSPQCQDQTFNEAVAILPLIICFRGKGTVRNHGGFVIWDANTQWNMIIRRPTYELRCGIGMSPNWQANNTYQKGTQLRYDTTNIYKILSFQIQMPHMNQWILGS